MTRKMADAVNPNNIPVGVYPLVAGYINGPVSQWPAAGWARHAGHSILVRITVFASTNDGHVLDVELGDATPAQAPPWVRMRRAAGADPTVYCSEAVWPAVRKAFDDAKVAQPHYWVAAYPGEGATVIPAGAIAHQYVDLGPLDESVVADYWPGVDQGGPVSGPVDLTPGATNAVWMQQCQIVWPKDSPNARLAIAQGAKANADGSVTESHPAALWLEVIAGREALEAQELDAFKTGLSALQTSTAQVDADVKAGDASLAGQLATLGASVDGLVKAVAALQSTTSAPAGSYTLDGNVVLRYSGATGNPAVLAASTELNPLTGGTP